MIISCDTPSKTQSILTSMPFKSILIDENIENIKQKMLESTNPYIQRFRKDLEKIKSPLFLELIFQCLIINPIPCYQISFSRLKGLILQKKNEAKTKLFLLDFKEMLISVIDIYKDKIILEKKFKTLMGILAITYRSLVITEILHFVRKL